MKRIKKVSLSGKFPELHAVWDPRIAAVFDQHEIKLVKCTGPGDVLKHETDVFYLVFRGELMIVFKDETLKLNAGDFIVIPKGAICKLASVRIAEVMIISQEGYAGPANLNTERMKLKKI